MAEKKHRSQAERAVSASKPKKKKPAKAKVSLNKSVKAMTDNAQKKERTIPVRGISGTILLGLFVLFLVIFLNPDGAVLKLLESVLYGLVGKVAFVVSIPSLLYLFIVHAFSGKRPIKMRTICMCLFIVICGCISHLSLEQNGLPGGFALVSELYTGGLSGTTGGVICGLITMLLSWLLGSVVPWIVLIIAAILTLLGAMQITIPSIVRAIQERPRPQWEQEEPVRQEPAAMVVNHIANKRIAYMEQHRHQTVTEDVPADITAPTPAPSTAKSKNKRVSDMIRQIDADLEAPVAAASSNPFDVDADSVDVIGHTKPQAPVEMPPLQDVAKEAAPERVTAAQAQASAKEVAAEIAESQATEQPK